MADAIPSILLTGATGSLGSELLPGLLEAYPDHRIELPMRARNDQSVAERLRDVLDYGGVQGPARSRVRAFAADLGAPRLGLGADAYGALTRRVDVVYHLAASVNFDEPLETARRSNVATTEQVLELSRRAADGKDGLRLHHVSTAYVCGDRRGPLAESELAVGQGFWNSYEQSKLESEERVAQAASELAVTIYRPSQVLGDSRSGRIRKFFGFYEFLKIAIRGRLRVLLGDADARPDMVPSDYVCRALLHLSRDPDTVGQTFHLVAGLERSISLHQLADLVYELTRTQVPEGVRIPRPHILHPDTLLGADNDILKRSYDGSPLKLLMCTYLPYVSYERDFDVSATRERLSRAGIEMTPIEEVIAAAVRYAVGCSFSDRTAPDSAAVAGGVSLRGARE